MWIPFYRGFFIGRLSTAQKVNIVGRYATTSSPDFRCPNQRLNNTLYLSRSAVTHIQFSCCFLRVVVVVVVVVGGGGGGGGGGGDGGAAASTS